MASLMPLVQQMVISGIVRRHSSSRLVNARTALMAASVLLTGAGLVFGLIAEYFWLKIFFQPDVAALATSGSAFALALAFAAIIKLMNYKKIRTQPADIIKIISQIAESFCEELEDPIRENPKTALMFASLAGFMAGDRRA